MSLVKAVNFQVGQSVTATNNFCLYQPSTPDGTVRLGIGNAGATSGDVLIASSTGISTPSLVVSGSTAPTNGMFLPAANTLAWSTNSSEKLRLDSSGNLGLGVTPSAWNTLPAIQVSTYGGLSAGAGYTRLSSNAYLSTYPNTWSYINNNYATLYEHGVGQHRWYTAPSGTAGNAISFTQAMTLDASGNLLVGTTSSSITSADGFFVRPTGGNTTGMFVGSAGNTSANSDITYSVYSRSLSQYQFYVGYGGTVYARSTTISALSDQRLKENIRDLDEGLATILALKPRKFDWKEGKGKNIKDDRGFIAQEFEQVLPDLIDTWKDPAPEGEEPYKSVNANLIPTLVKAIQELSAELNALKQKVNA